MELKWPEPPREPQEEPLMGTKLRICDVCQSLHGVEAERTSPALQSPEWRRWSLRYRLNSAVQSLEARIARAFKSLWNSSTESKRVEEKEWFLPHLGPWWKGGGRTKTPSGWRGTEGKIEQTNKKTTEEEKSGEVEGSCCANLRGIPSIFPNVSTTRSF